MSQSFPTTPEALTAAWANDALAASLGGARVKDVAVTPVGEQGQTSQVVRVSLHYDRDPGGTAPSSVIAKLPSPDAHVRAVQRELGSYVREVFFYRDFGADPGISVPRCHAAEVDFDSGDFLLVLEDMSHCRVGDLWSSDIADVRQATSALARFHARWWCSPELRKFAWLPQHDATPFHQMLGAAYRGSLPMTLSKFGDHFAGHAADVARTLAERFDAWVAYTPGAPFTLVHNDFHPKQLFFPGPDSGRFAAFDWQSVIAGRPTFDLARLLLKGLRPAELREHAQSLLELYRGELSAGGVDIPLSDIELEWRGSLLHTLAYTVFVLAQTDVGELDAAASARGVDYRQRLITDLAESLEDFAVHEILLDP